MLDYSRKCDKPVVGKMKSGPCVLPAGHDTDKHPSRCHVPPDESHDELIKREKDSWVWWRYWEIWEALQHSGPK